MCRAAHDGSMEQQHQIKRTLSQPEAVAYIQQYLATSVPIGRTRLASDLCDHFGFVDQRGRQQVTSCLRALRRLEQRGHFVLPASQQPGKFGKQAGQRRLGTAVALPTDLPEEVGQIEQLDLVLVDEAADLCLWNELMIRDHPQGTRPLVGRQLRYLIRSEHGLLGGVGFSAAALNLEARDRWIGWDFEGRQAGLHHVIGLSRLLIRDGVRCRNLASRILGMAVRTLPRDFDARYGYRPLLVESFVDPRDHQGTCYKAANWHWVGKTKGRGRQDREEAAPESVKDIYLYPLAKDFRAKLGLDDDAGLGARSVRVVAEGTDWVANEFMNAPLGDGRLSQRLVAIAADQADNPGSSYGAASQGVSAKVKAYYRFIDQPDESAVTPDNILLPHREQTIRRMKAESMVLCVQDGTDLKYSHLSDCEGLGQIGTNQTGAVSKGLHLHSTLALTSQGLPLGVLRTQYSAPPAPSSAGPADGVKKTFAWSEGLRDVIALKAQMPQTAIVNVMDREADLFELFDQQRRQGSSVDLLIRAKHNRRTTGADKLFETMQKAPVQAEFSLEISRQSARPKKSKQKARPGRPERVAQVGLRFATVELKPPQDHQDKAPISLQLVHLCEEAPPEGQSRLEWFLLTTLPVTTVDQAKRCVDWYRLRWRIEDWHRVLKSGCRIEERSHRSAVRLERAITINTVIAWRIMLMTLLGRESPSLSADTLFSEIEIDVLTIYAQKKNSPHPILSVQR
jgi:hypothetical protein